MDEISGLVERNWFEIGSLLIQCVILATVAWYGRKTLRFVRAFFQYLKMYSGRSWAYPMQRKWETVAELPLGGMISFDGCKCR